MRRLAVMIVIWAGSLAVSPASAQVVPGAPNTDWDLAHNEFTLGVLREYTVLITRWREALNEGRAAAAAESYTEKAQLLVSGRPAVAGRDSVGAWLGQFAGTLVEIRMGLAEFQASDRIAVAAGALVFSARDAEGGVHPYSGSHLTLLFREGRRWRIQSQVLHFMRSDSLPR